MKKISAFLLMGLICITSMKAAVLTVSNNNSPGQFADLQLACNTAQSGDTILIHASPYTYGNISVKKPLVLIGEGARPAQQFSYGSLLDEVSLESNGAISNASGTKIFGIKANVIRFKHNGLGNFVGNIVISRCFIGTLDPSGEALYYVGAVSNQNSITNNVIQSMVSLGLTYPSIGNSVFTNNIIHVMRTSGDFLVWGLGGNNIISNNIITGELSCRLSLITNNIFLNLDNGSTLSIFTNWSGDNTISNNLFYNPNNTTPIQLGNVVFGSNTGTGNIFQQDPLFLSSQNWYVFNYPPPSGPYADFHLQSSSPGHN